jgi:hypothetical protein
MKYTADELKISQIPLLLDDYKRLALENLQLKKALSSASSLPPTTAAPNSSLPPTLTPTISSPNHSVPPIVLTSTEQSSMLG